MKSLEYLFLKRRNVMELFIINYPKEQILSGTNIEIKNDFKNNYSTSYITE
jgi:hypothetical protein